MFAKTKELEEWHFTIFFQISLMSDLIADDWILVPDAAFRLLW